MTTEIIRVVERRRKYHWPEAQLNFWLIVMCAAGATQVGVFGYFMHVQAVMRQGVPWIFPYMIAVGCLTLIFLFIILVLISQRQLLPGIVVLGSFILFVLWLTGLIETAIQLYGPKGSVNSYCTAYRPSSGPSASTLAWLETQGICNDWRAAFAMLIVGTVFLLWMMVMAWQVNRDDFE
ncbi:hypothetical protein G7Y79_00016g041100 [Physcia stellaris]|nr:hypothetical protein G7Y79_00016g041100 [Physcia stellaris]